MVYYRTELDQQPSTWSAPSFIKTFTHSIETYTVKDTKIETEAETDAETDALKDLLKDRD